MALAPFSEQLDKQDDDGTKSKADKHRFENDLIAMEADKSKFLRTVESMEVDLRVMQKKYTALGFEMKDKEAEVKKSQNNLNFLEEEIRVLRKKINNL